MLSKPILRLTPFYLILFRNKVLTRGIYYCNFWWLVNNLHYWFLYGKKIYTSYAMIYSQLHWYIIIKTDELIKLLLSTRDVYPYLDVGWEI